jgi:hypothetical protein
VILTLSFVINGPGSVPPATTAILSNPSGDTSLLVISRVVTPRFVVAPWINPVWERSTARSVKPVGNVEGIVTGICSSELKAEEKGRVGWIENALKDRLLIGYDQNAYHFSRVK